jgi:hypothetical protein
MERCLTWFPDGTWRCAGDAMRARRLHTLYRCSLVNPEHKASRGHPCNLSQGGRSPSAIALLVGATRLLQARSILDTGRSVVRNFSGQMSRERGLRTYVVAFPVYPRIPLVRECSRARRPATGWPPPVHWHNVENGFISTRCSISSLEIELSVQF